MSHSARVAFFVKKRGVTVGRPEHPPKKRGAKNALQKESLMILFVRAKLKDIYEQGRNFNWPKPDRCPRCGSMRLWGHGFVLAYFDKIAHGVYLRRYRCPDCNCITRMKVKGYFDRFHTTIHTIRSCLMHRLIYGRWLTMLSTSRQRHWLAALKRKTMALFDTSMDLMAAFDRLTTMGIIPVSRAI